MAIGPSSPDHDTCPGVFFCVPSTAVMSIHALWVTESLLGFLTPWELLHSGCCLFPSEVLLGDFPGAICDSEHPLVTEHLSGAPCALEEPVLDSLFAHKEGGQ